jgi:hypothetical protein
MLAVALGYRAGGLAKCARPDGRECVARVELDELNTSNAFASVGLRHRCTQDFYSISYVAYVSNVNPRFKYS